MKKVVVVLVLMLLVSVGVKAQNCRDIVLPHVGYSQDALNDMPNEKLQWYCDYSHNSFYLTDQVPSDAVVYDVNEVKSVRDKSISLTPEQANNLSTLSYYAYNFNEFQARHFEATVYFRTPNAAHGYLALRTVKETFGRTDYPENYIKD